MTQHRLGGGFRWGAPSPLTGCIFVTKWQIYTKLHYFHKTNLNFRGRDTDTPSQTLPSRLCLDAFSVSCSHLISKFWIRHSIDFSITFSSNLDLNYGHFTSNPPQLKWRKRHHWWKYRQFVNRYWLLVTSKLVVCTALVALDDGKCLHQVVYIFGPAPVDFWLYSFAVYKQRSGELLPTHY